jgi:signal transduction histidine kinase
MIKKLKLKFILNNMLLVGIVIATIFSSLCLFIYIMEENKLTVALTDNIKIAQANLPALPDNTREPDGIVYDVSFVMLLDKNGAILATTQTDLNESTIEAIAQKALNSEQARRSIPNMNLSFMKFEIEQGTLISVISREQLNTRVSESITQSVVATIFSLLLFLYISKRLADIAINPVAKAWDQQRQFLADASHDLKTPLTVILANNNIIASHKDESVESQMKWIESTNEEAGRMRDLINKMLELAKGEEAKEELKLGEIDLSETVENAILQFEVVAFEKNVEIESDIQPYIITKTHRPTFSKILEILFDNAIKYSNPNANIKVTLHQSSKKIHFTINNKGEYIKPDELPHVFERFYRTNKEREVGGHGLGLSIAKKKCDLIGAKISVKSNEIDGTTFTVILKAKNKG